MNYRFLIESIDSERPTDRLSTVGWEQSQPTIRAEMFSVRQSVTPGCLSKWSCHRHFWTLRTTPAASGAGQGGGLPISILKHARHRLDWLASSYEVNISKINGLHAPYGQRPQKTQHEVCVTVGVCVGERDRDIERERENTDVCWKLTLIWSQKLFCARLVSQFSAIDKC